MWRTTLLSLAILAAAFNIAEAIRTEISDLKNDKQAWVREEVELRGELLKYRPPFDIGQQAWVFVTRYESDRLSDMANLEVSMHGRDLVATWDSERRHLHCVAVIVVPAWKFRLGPDCTTTP